MSLLFRIVYAAHANGTHHKLALDGLAEMAGPSRVAWQRVFLAHAEQFMDGAKAPDTKFKDFKNHVLHVRDGYWGGAADLATTWYARTVDELRAEKWADAVYAAGVLSHYVTDPLMPFHTGQADAESAIHAATEWSINRSYDDLRKLGLSRRASGPVVRPTGAAWLRAMVIDGAERSNVHYERLIAHYDIKRGAVDPPAGLDEVSRSLVADLLVDAAARFAVILDAATEEAGVAPPAVDLSIDTVLAALKIPMKALAKRLSNAEDRSVVLAQYDELMATGTVEKTLREDDRLVRDLHAAEVLAPRRALAERDRAAVIAGTTAAAPSPAIQAAGPLGSVSPARPAEIAASAMPMPVVGKTGARVDDATVTEPGDAAPSARVTPATRPPKVHLALVDPVEAAPVIGSKLAAKLETAGIVTVAELMAADPQVLARKLGDARIAASDVATWQRLSQIVMDVPGLRGTHAQLLAGAGYATAVELASAEAGRLVQEVNAFAGSPAGQRILRDQTTPSADTIGGWIDSARRARGRRAAA